ncbi:hypothetical protein DFH06DRAFT_1225102 [Mycena polygramma]|nr:hypothetical protein DFH06DRAFT_1225102 [Mycena polygramma]
MDNLTAAVCHVLCNEEAWHWDTYDGHKLVFHRDGTGEIISRAELCIWIVATFEWKVHDPASVEFSPVPPPQRSVFQDMVLRSPPPPPVLRASIDFQLTKRRPLLYGKVVQARINEDVLLDAAFESRVLGITVDRGRFRTASDSNTYGAQAFQLRLSFDVSPYPAKDVWRPEQHNMVESMGQPLMTEFCARKLSQEEQGRCVAM